MFPHLLHLAVALQLDLLVPGDVGIAEQSADLALLISCAGCVKGVFRKLLAHGDTEESLLCPFAQIRFFQQERQKLQQVARQVAVVARHGQMAHSILLQHMLRSVG